MTGNPTCGLRHLALRVRDLSASQAFYVNLLGMRVVWQPDPDNVYLSSGSDNLALHRIEPGAIDSIQPPEGQSLDHLGFIMESPESVDGMFEAMQKEIGGYGGRIVKQPKRHRDESYSFYMADPDGNVIQILYEPTISAMEIVHTKQD